MVHVIIGQSGSGKTTFVRRRWIEGCELVRCEDQPVPYMLAGEVALVGLYATGKRTEGTDTLPYNAIEKIIRTVSGLATAGREVVVEGDRINNARFMEFLARSGFPVTLYMVACSLETSRTRLLMAGSRITSSFVKATRTKSLHNYMTYGARMNGQIIDGG
jgi:hypothetical protein